MSNKYTILGYNPISREYEPVLIMNNATEQEAEKLAFDLTYIKIKDEVRFITVGNVDIDLIIYSGFKFCKTPYIYDSDYTIRPKKEYVVLLKFIDKVDDCDGVIVSFICHENDYYLKLGEAKKEQEQKYGAKLKFGRII